METTTRLATEEDLEAILAIYNDAILHTTSVYNYKPHTIEMRREWFRHKKEEGFPVFVLIQNGEIAGFSTFGPFRVWAAYKYTVESSVYIHPLHRGKGLGKLLYIPLIEAAKQKQLHTLVAGIDAENTASIKLHEYFGFRQVAHFKEVGYKFNKWLDLVFMQLILTTPEEPVEE
jgi:L-amino acid N-acyltransferase YncA